MKISCGTDIIEINRIGKAIEKNGQTFLEEIYTKNEIQYCESRKNLKYQHYAARFAAKEAIFKAVNGLLKDRFDLKWKNMEILNNKNGRPEVYFIDIKIPQIISIDISISHCKEYAVANVVMLYKEGVE